MCPGSQAALCFHDVLQGQFAGQCILYASVSYNRSAEAIKLQGFGSSTLCYFVSAVSVCVAIYCSVLILYWIYSSCVDDRTQRTSLWTSVSLGACGIISFFLLVSGCILRIGKDHLCLSIINSAPTVTSCKGAENETWLSPYDGRQFYSNLQSAEKSVWVNLFFWVLIVIIMSVQRCQGAEVRPGRGNMNWTPSETEPFLHRPPRPQ
ncbi:transmembrane protein 179B-like [Scleropages formosus]|uniref:Transmembrane protein 179B-like n=1 Tax=Scleropages formosus TaxID=113540 RepID=A0A0P7Y099_SCLFO|nr:transmembrane protein 179B-like [Scleropages formosus]